MCAFTIVQNSGEYGLKYLSLILGSASIFFRLFVELGGTIVLINSLAFVFARLFDCGAGGGADVGGGMFANLPLLLKDLCCRAVGDLHRSGKTVLRWEWYDGGLG
jgi:hypothetical protein